MARFKEKFNSEIKAQLIEEFKYENVMQIPKIEKIVLNMGLGEAKENKNVIKNAVEEIRKITGQEPVVMEAKKSIANFKLREGMQIGAKVTLRNEKMYEFLDKLITIALPRVRDFKGVKANAFDGRGNYSLGLKEQLLFPEITYDDVEAIRGMNITIVTSAKSDEEAKKLLSLFGMPFAK
ncbi:50S ribosomal protein L5 [Clostridiaceae bacterium HSG29]|nr:50S ribosomal protein L5 [Clostridiaceae bacterium HSG29]